MILLPGLLLILWGELCQCLEEDGGSTFKGNIRRFAVANNEVYIATEERLYRLNHDLSEVQSVTLRGILKKANNPVEDDFYRVSETAEGNATLSVNTLLPFVKNNTLVTCGVINHDCGHCEVLDLRNISKLVYKEGIQVGPLRRNNASVTILVDVETDATHSATYILTAIQQYNDTSKPGRCFSYWKTVNLQDTDNKSKGGIFSVTDKGQTPVIQSKDGVEFVDGFQINSTIYLFSNVHSDSKSNKVRLIWLEGKSSKATTVSSLRGVTLSVSEAAGGANRLLASSVIPGGPPVLWSGVFSADGGQTNTELVVFDISPDLTGDKDADPDFYANKASDKEKPNIPPMRKPKAVLFRQNDMTSVLAVRQKAWMVFFIGTRDGQLIKLAVDKNYHTTCPVVLYRADDDHKVFPKIQLDQVDGKHVYVPFQNQLKRVPVSHCSTHTNVQECLSAQDPYCVWCGSKNSCTFEDNCKDSVWFSIPDDYQEKMVSYQVGKESDDQISLTIQTHLTVSQTVVPRFACQFSVTSGTLCSRENPPKFPQCTCIIQNHTLSAEGKEVALRIILEKTTLLEKFKLIRCTDIRGPPSSALCQQCISAGCGWSTNICTWANLGAKDDSVCQRMEIWRNVSRPEISSITPSVVSFYGRNHAVLSGHNLRDVVGVRMKAHADCTPKHSPVWNNTGVSLTFHIPSTDSKGVVQVCALLPDGSCHGNAAITYGSLPSCTNIEPNRSWLSGGRRVTLMGSHLDFVDGIIHNHIQQTVILPNDSNSQNLIYETPTAENTLTSTISLRVANETLPCTTSITYDLDPEFTTFVSTKKGDDVQIVLRKKADDLEMTPYELSVWGIQGGKHHRCEIEFEETTSTDFFRCEIKKISSEHFEHIEIKFGNKTKILYPKAASSLLRFLLVLLLFPFIIIIVVILYQSKKRKLTETMNKRIEDLELDIRNNRQARQLDSSSPY